MHWNDNYQIQDSPYRRGREGIAFREEGRRGLPKRFQCFFFSPEAEWWLQGIYCIILYSSFYFEEFHNKQQAVLSCCGGK